MTRNKYCTVFKSHIGEIKIMVFLACVLYSSGRNINSSGSALSNSILSHAKFFWYNLMNELDCYDRNISTLYEENFNSA